MWLSDIRNIKNVNWRTVTFDDCAAALVLLMPLFLIMGRVAAEGATFLSAVFFLYHCVRTRDWGWLNVTWVRIALILWAYLFISGLFAMSDPLTGFKRAVTWGRFLLLAFAIVFWYSRRSWWQNAVGRCLVVIVICVAIDALVQYMFGFSLSGHAKPVGVSRLTGPFTRFIVGIYMAKLFWPAFAHVLQWAQTQASRAKRFFGAALFCRRRCPRDLLSGERMAFLLTGLSLVTFFACAKGFRRALLMCAIPAVLLVLAVIATQPDVRNRATDASHMLTHFGDTVMVSSSTTR